MRLPLAWELFKFRYYGGSDGIRVNIHFLWPSRFSLPVEDDSEGGFRRPCRPNNYQRGHAVAHVIPRSRYFAALKIHCLSQHSGHPHNLWDFASTSTNR